MILIFDLDHTLLDIERLKKTRAKSSDLRQKRMKSKEIIFLKKGALVIIHMYILKF